MKPQILYLALAALLLFPPPKGFSQEMDLIVTVQGDSIACQIDSISETQIFFRMKSRGAKIHTHLDRKDVSVYLRKVIDRKAFLFEPGTSIITSPKPAISSLDQVQRNSVYVGIMTLMYSRMFPINKLGITLGAGIYNADGWGVLGESTLLLGGTKHFFEPGIMALYSLEPEYVYGENGEEISELSRTGFSLRTGYRYQGPKGLLIRAGVNLISFEEDVYLWPALSLGISF